jgi:hypothetical protein
MVVSRVDTQHGACFGKHGATGVTRAERANVFAEPEGASTFDEVGCASTSRAPVAVDCEERVVLGLFSRERCGCSDRRRNRGAQPEERNIVLTELRRKRHILFDGIPKALTIIVLDGEGSVGACGGA